MITAAKESEAVLYKLNINEELDKAEFDSKLEFKTDSGKHYYNS